MQFLLGLSLIELCALFMALAMVALNRELARALFQVAESGLGWIPWLGKKAANGVNAVAKRVDNVFGSAALRLEGATAAAWHDVATLFELTADAIWKATQVGARALWLVEVKYPLEVLSALAHGARRVVHQTTKVTTTTVKKVTVVERIGKAQVDALARKVRGIDKRLAAIAAAGAGAIALPLPRIGSLERGARATRKRLASLEHRFGRKAFAAAVATALGVLGLSWTRRECAKRNNDLLCRTNFDQLEGLLGGLILILGSISIVNLAEGMQDITDEVTEAARAFIREATAADAMPAPAVGLDAFNHSTQA